MTSTEYRDVLDLLALTQAEMAELLGVNPDRSRLRQRRTHPGARRPISRSDFIAVRARPPGANRG